MLLEFKFWFASLVFWLFGWSPEKDYEKKRDEIKMLDKCLIIGEPHTHILDIFIMIFMFWYYKLENLRFFITSKHMDPVVRILLKSLGGITVNRGQKNGLVDEIVKEINKKDKIFLQIGPSGKRAKTDKWRSGFYHIANNSGIPLLCGYIDSNTKTFGIERPFKLTGNYKLDMDKIRGIYKGKDGLNKKNNSVICIKEEETENRNEDEISDNDSNLRNRNNTTRITI